MAERKGSGVNEANSPTMIVFQGPSASGKTTLQARLNARRIVTWTSRSPRPGEKHGVDYVFSTRTEMDEMERRGLFLETTLYRGERYGTTHDAIRQALEAGELTTIILDAPGAAKLKALYPKRVLLVGVYAEREDCRRRLAERELGEADQQARLSGYEEEVRALRQCDLAVNNSDACGGSALALVDCLRAGFGAAAAGLRAGPGASEASNGMPEAAEPD